MRETEKQKFTTILTSPFRGCFFEFVWLTLRQKQIFLYCAHFSSFPQVVDDQRVDDHRVIWCKQKKRFWHLG